ncbi:hypothetical protein J2Z23_000394 [Lederbergia galactosidilyticus]|nr:hypothetical protein [Lederbergia galactosidilytica]
MLCLLLLNDYIMIYKYLLFKCLQKANDLILFLKMKEGEFCAIRNRSVLTYCLSSIGK